MWLVRPALVDPAPVPPAVQETLHQHSHRGFAKRTRAEVPAATELGRARPDQVARQRQIPVQRLEDVLPGSDGTGVADSNRLLSGQRAHDVSDDSVGCPVATAKDISGASRGEGHT